MSIGEKRTLNAYYKRRFYRGRTAFARAADFIALRVILLIACYLWFSFNVESIIAAAVLTAAAVGAISVFAELVKSVRLEKFILRENARLSKKLFSESLVLMPRSEFLDIVREYIKCHGKEFAGESLVYTAQTLSPVDEETVLCACRAANRRGCKSLFIFSSASVSQPARDIAARYDGLSVAFISGDMLASNKKAERIHGHRPRKMRAVSACCRGAFRTLLFCKLYALLQDACRRMRKPCRAQLLCGAFAFRRTEGCLTLRRSSFVSNIAFKGI